MGKHEGVENKATDTLGLLSLCVCFCVSICATLSLSLSFRNAPKQSHNWCKSHIDTDNYSLKDTDIKIQRENLQPELLPFKD